MTPGKRIWLALALVIAFAAAIALVWRREPPQIVTFPNGQQYRFGGVTYGTKHVQPTAGARLFSHVPATMTNLVRRVLGKRLGPISSLTTSEPSLVVWFENQPLTNALPASVVLAGLSLRAMLANESNIVAGRHDAFFGSRLGASWTYAAFQAVPKRSRVLQLVFSNGTNEVGRVSFPNPLLGRFPQWQPEPLPAVKKSGDLEVTLTEFTTGSTWNASPQAAFKWKFNSTNEQWAVRSAELSDATGNRSYEFGPVWHGTNGFYFEAALWPDEAAWSLKLELKRRFGFLQEELVTFKNLPVLRAGSTTTIVRTNTAGKYQLILSESIEHPLHLRDGVAASADTPKLLVTMAGNHDGLALDLVEVVTDAGAKMRILPEECETSIGWIQILWSIPADVKTVDITFAVQKTRTVEFFVKPR